MSDSISSPARAVPAHDLSRLDRLVEKLKTLDSAFAMGVAYLFLALMWLADHGSDLVGVAYAVPGALMLVTGIRRGGPFPRPSAAEVDTGRVPSERRHAGRVTRVLAGLVGAFALFVALRSIQDGAWFSVPFGFLIGFAFCLIAATGGGRVWIERPQGETMEPAAS